MPFLPPGVEKRCGWVGGSRESHLNRPHESIKVDLLTFHGASGSRFPDHSSVSVRSTITISQFESYSSGSVLIGNCVYCPAEYRSLCSCSGKFFPLTLFRSQSSAYHPTLRDTHCLLSSVVDFTLKTLQFRGLDYFRTNRRFRSLLLHYMRQSTFCCQDSCD